MTRPSAYVRVVTWMRVRTTHARILAPVSAALRDAQAPFCICLLRAILSFVERME